MSLTLQQYYTQYYIFYYIIAPTYSHFVIAHVESNREEENLINNKMM